MNSVDSLTWDAVEARLAKGMFAILPVGACAKQHGWHLPMRTDQVQAERLAAARREIRRPHLADVHPRLLSAFVDYAGSCNLSCGVFEALVRELATSLLGYAPRGLLIVDAGISTIASIDRAIAGPDTRRRTLHLKIHEGTRYREAAARLATQAWRPRR